MVERAAALRSGGRALEIIDRCNLTVLLEPGQEDLPAFLAQHQVGGGGWWRLAHRRVFRMACIRGTPGQPPAGVWLAG